MCQFGGKGVAHDVSRVRSFRRVVVMAILALFAVAWQLTVSAPVRAAELGGVFDSIDVAQDIAGPTGT